MRVSRSTVLCLTLVLLMSVRAVAVAALAFSDVRTRACCANHCGETISAGPRCGCCVVAPDPREAALTEQRTSHGPINAPALALPNLSTALPTLDATAALVPFLPASGPPRFLMHCVLRC